MDIQVVSGEIIRTLYGSQSEHPAFGGSSMSAMKFQPCFDIYTENPNVELLVAIESKKVIGRTLLWHTTDGCIHHDTIYAPRVWREYTIANIVWNHIGSYLEANRILPPPRYVEKTVRLDKAMFKYYPFLDVFSYLSEDEEGWRLKNTPDESFPIYVLDTHEGDVRFYGEDRVRTP